MRGEPERIMLWTQAITGLEVDELTAVHVLDAASACRNSVARRYHSCCG
jgi:hypothetical protein